MLGTAGTCRSKSVAEAWIIAPIFSPSEQFCMKCWQAERAFRGNSSVETMTAILKDEPPEILSGESQVPPWIA